MIKIFEEANWGFNSGTSDSDSVSSVQEMIDPLNSKPNYDSDTNIMLVIMLSLVEKILSYIDSED